MFLNYSDNCELEPSSEEWLIQEAAEAGDIEKVKSFLANGVDVNIKSGERLFHSEMPPMDIWTTPLTIAAKSGKTEMVKFLLQQKGIDINTSDFLGNADLDHNTLGYTALHYAAMYNNVEIMSVLLGNPNIELNVKNGCQQTPVEVLIDAFFMREFFKASITEEKCKECLELLHRAGATINRESLASQYGERYSQIACLLPSEEANQEGAQSYTPRP